ncbi:hypothetical protein ACFOWE_29180 [Planomonospora corallina]|uniref:Uncharacterized protein n=1 Tax=Planomonospora corallina TaxID=1806052 RepID=A0ABV8IHC2_9ACTN
MSEHEPYTFASVSIEEDRTRLAVSFKTPYLSVLALRAGDTRPFLTLASSEAEVTVTTTGGGPVTGDDVSLARELVKVATRYLADCERLHAERFPGQVAL